MSTSAERGRTVLFVAWCSALTSCSMAPGHSVFPDAAPSAATASQLAALRSDSALAQEHQTSSGFETLYNFGGGKDGKFPEANLIAMHGKFYGTTYSGGAHGEGTVFEVSKTGKERVIYSFKGGSDGAEPQANLLDVDGELYGTTTFGGSGPSGGNGTVFEVSTSGSEQVLYRFQGGSDGQYPYAGLISVGGELYGTTEFGGGPTGGGGTVFAISTSGAERVVYAFKDQPDGAYPLAGLIAVHGMLYGTTAGGGNLDGTVFVCSTSGDERVLYTFRGKRDGETPGAPLVDLNGVLYGTTVYGGSSDPSISNGTVFAVSLSGAEKILYRFQGESDGASPLSGLTAVNGALYGTTYFGGNGTPSSHGDGTIFEVSTSGHESVVFRFQGGSGGGNPEAGLLLDKGALYGTTTQEGLSGPSGGGTVFEFSP